ncbi:MAG: PRC-barrel domain-containing protein [Thermoplasmata archaeon]|nr:PRC-barrel domain-containing protein [Thermoplasmata archaeon]
MVAQSIFERMKESIWPGKRKVVGLPVYLEENGEVLGMVSDIVESKDGKILSYVLENEVSSFQIPVDNVLVTKRGLIFIPSWYADADRFIKTLEIQEALMPEVFILLAEENVPKEQIKGILDKATPETKRVIQEGLQLLEATSRKLAGFKKESAKIYSMISEMTEKRVLGVIDRREFASNILELKRKAQILEASMKKANEILSRLESSALLKAARAQESVEKKIEKPGMEGVTHGAPQISPEQRAKIKKFRVLKVEKELKEMEEKLKASEEEIAKRVNAEVEKKLVERENLLRSEFIRALDAIERNVSALASEKLGKTQKETVDKILAEIKRAKTTALAEQKAKVTEGGEAKPEVIDHERRTCKLCGAVFESTLESCPVCGLKYEEKGAKKEEPIKASKKKVEKK